MARALLAQFLVVSGARSQHNIKELQMRGLQNLVIVSSIFVSGPARATQHTELQMHGLQNLVFIVSSMGVKWIDTDQQ